MIQHSKSCIILTSILLMSLPIVNSSSVDSEVGQLTSPIEDGIWVNNTLEVNGSTTLPPQDADWVLYDVTVPNIGLPIILASGDFFTSVTPIDEGLWIWSIVIDVSGFNCTCMLEVTQMDDSGEELLNRIIFIGEGPHSPVISHNHDSSIIVDGEYVISSRAILADSQTSDSKLILNWCLAPNGACDGTLFDSEVNASWENDIGTFSINVSSLGLDDGVWKFTYHLQDVFLRTSAEIEMTVFVDQTNPTSVLICPENALEGEMIVIDGSGSTDGVWSNNLQSIWYVTDPDGITYLPTSNTTDEMLNIALSKSGNYTVRLDVIDWVGRMSSSNTTILVSNVAPIIDLQLEGSSVKNPNSWQFLQDESLELVAAAIETGDDSNSLIYSWYLNDELISTSVNLSLSDLDVGVHNLRLVVTDNDGAEDSHEIEVTVKAQSKSESNNFNITAVFVLVGIIGFSIMIFRRMRMSENEASVLPKWDSTHKSNSANKESERVSENDMWTDEDTS